MSTTEPGLREQASRRTTFRLAGVVLLLTPATWRLRAGFCDHRGHALAG